MNDTDLYFLFQCEKGLKEKKLDSLKQYRERLDFETKVIIDMGFSSYMLVIWDITRAAREMNIMLGCGRGSVAGSLAAYCLKIHTIDPIEWNLLFSRFLNWGRKDSGSPPDIDLDISDEDREKVFDYLRTKYGEDRVAHIGTFGTLKAKGAVRAAQRTLGLQYEVGDKLAKLLLPDIHGKSQSISTSIEKVPKLKEYLERDCDEKQVIERGMQLENLVVDVGTHAAGAVIANQPVVEIAPLFLGKDDAVTTQWDMRNVEEVGLIKFDVLGLKTLTKIKKAIQIIKSRHGVEIDTEKIPRDDDNVLKLFREGHLAGIFQMEKGAGIRDLCMQVAPTHIKDLSAIVAIWRPGPLGSDGLPKYLEWRQGKGDPDYLIPELEPILGDTGGFLIYQEQIMRVARDLCSYDEASADLLRKAAGKKLEDKMAVHEKKFVNGWVENGYPKDKGIKLWNDIKKFASYGFNLSHAAAYSTISYYTAYLKTYYPTEFMCASLICDQDDSEQLHIYLRECKRLGIQISPPDVNISQFDFTVATDDKIVFGLSSIKGIRSAADKIIKERESGQFKNLLDLCQRFRESGITKTSIQALAYSGALDNLPDNLDRSRYIGSIETTLEYIEDTKKYQKALIRYKEKIDACEQRLRDIEDDKRSPKGNKLKPLKEPPLPIKPEYKLPLVKELPKLEILTNEYNYLGMFMSGHPLDEFENEPKVSDALKSPSIATTGILGVLSHIKPFTTSKTKKRMAFGIIEDRTNQIEIVVFPSSHDKYGFLLQTGMLLKVYGEISSKKDSEYKKLTVSKIKVPEEKKETVSNISARISVNKISDLLERIDTNTDNMYPINLNLEVRNGSIELSGFIKTENPISIVNEFN